VKHFLKYLIFCAAITIASCDSSDERGLLDASKDYQPLQTGHFQLYDVLEVIYTLGVPETLKYELKTVISDSFPNATGGYTYVMQRSKRNEGQQNFFPLDTWSIRVNDSEVVVQEQNISFVKIRLPAEKNVEWDGNLYNTLGEDFYLIEDAKTPYELNGTTFDDCVVINQNDNNDYVVYLDHRKEVYAKHTGLIYKESTLLNYCTIGGCLGQQQVESGTILKQTIKAHGLE
jgi:hypothetical protein